MTRLKSRFEKNTIGNDPQTKIEMILLKSLNDAISR